MVDKNMTKPNKPEENKKGNYEIGRAKNYFAYKVKRAMKPNKPAWEKEFDRRIDIDNYPELHEGNSLLTSYDGVIEEWVESKYELDRGKTKEFIRTLLDTQKRQMIAIIEKQEYMIDVSDPDCILDLTGQLDLIGKAVADIKSQIIKELQSY